MSADAVGGWGVRGTWAVACLLAAVAPAARLGVMPGAYLEGPSAEAALDSCTMRWHREAPGITYRFLYEDADGEGRVRYHYVSTGGGDISLVLTCDFLWLGSFDAFDYRPAGWNYVHSNSEEWEEAYYGRSLRPTVPQGTPAADGHGNGEQSDDDRRLYSADGEGYCGHERALGLYGLGLLWVVHETDSFLYDIPRGPYRREGGA